MAGWLQRLLPTAPERTRTVIADARGIYQVERSGRRTTEVRMGWADVDTVVAFKQDCYTVDQIWVGFLDRDGHMQVGVSESDEGYEQFVEQLPEHLPGCLRFEQWFFEVAFPAFEPNRTELYRRGAS